MSARYAILMDGSFVKRKLYNYHQRPIGAADVVRLADVIKTNAMLQPYDLLSIFYYDTVAEKDISATSASQLHMELALSDKFQVRVGQLVVSPSHKQILPKSAKELVRKYLEPTDIDFLVDAISKRADIRISMDMADLVLRNMVRTVVVISGNHDFIPSKRFVNREGVRMIRCTFENNIVEHTPSKVESFISKCRKKINQ